jgi:hypothetical protein
VNIIPMGSREMLRRRAVAALSVAGLLTSSCGHNAGLPPVLTPVALHLSPNAGFRIQDARTAYLAVTSQNTRFRPMLPLFMDIVSSELRTAALLDVVVLVDRGAGCVSGAPWADTCDNFHLPLQTPDPMGIIVFCDVQELDPYAPARLGMTIRVRRPSDGMELAAAQGVWEAPNPDPAPPGFVWPWNKTNVEPVDYHWDQHVEDNSTAALIRRAARDCVQSLLGSPVATPAANNVPMLPPAELGGEDPFLGPTGPDGTCPPAGDPAAGHGPELPVLIAPNGSVESAPEEPGLQL